MSENGSERPVALVTGAGRWPEQSPGLGAAIARELALAGHEIVVMDREPGPAEATAADLRDEGHAAEGVGLDVTDAPAALEVLAGIAERKGRIDVLAHAAALTMHSWGLRSFHRITPDQCDLELDVTLRGTLNVARGVLPTMYEAGRGAMVFVSSMLAFEPCPRQTLYGVAKAAIVSFTRSLAAETGPEGIRVNCVCPGTMRTRVTEAMPDQYMKPFIDGSALKRIADPAEVARVVRFLASDEASYVNGAALRVDGGGTGML